MRFFLTVFFLALLTGCGNIDQGKVGIPQGSSNSSAAATATAAPSSGVSYSQCNSFSVYGGSDPGFAQAFNGASACAGVSSPQMLKVRVSANFPASQALCVVPLSASAAYNATCFTLNGQTEIPLSTSQYTQVAIVRQSDLVTYLNYLQGTSASYPPMGFANVR